MRVKYELKHICKQSGARYGILTVGDLEIETPIFMPVGTKATVKTLSPSEIEEVSEGLILANTYHLWLTPGMDVINLHNGAKSFMQWDKALLTDSGGFQVFSLSTHRKITEEGVHFTNPRNGDKLFLTPEESIKIQHQIGADIIMSFDECPPVDSKREYMIESIDRTLRWAKRGKDVHNTDQALFGIVQGGTYLDLREYSAKKTIEIDFPGYAIGGLSLGETKKEMDDVIKHLNNILPKDKPRYLMGVGTPEDLINGVIGGVDMFDCVLPTRNARHGQIFTTEGRLIIKNKEFENDLKPLDPNLPSKISKYSRSYVRHLIRENEILGLRILTYQNLLYLKELMRQIREAIKNDRLLDFKEELKKVYNFEV
ncbi:MAG TPA: tRNA guanosine(34) transglycosylase Tgt [Acholeplasma sp.]|jgi:queuine tRNA-ribosyltransferase|nr:tRNA guanosine(34) transglycosylase Tgt [Acholeplasma sp.]